MINLLFDHIWAIDWSGAKPPLKGSVSVACVDKSGLVESLKPSDSPFWSRQAIVHQIEQLIHSKARVFIGIDAAFSLPLTRAHRYFNDAPRAHDLWALVDDVCADEPDFYASCFWGHDNYGRDFWVNGKRPRHFENAPQREIEVITARLGYGHPESPYKLIGTKQVGKGGLSAMRLLHYLKIKYPHQVGVWPFDPDKGQNVWLAEIYPRLFLKQAGFAQAKVRQADDISTALSYFKARYQASGTVFTDHDTDALIAAAGIRELFLSKKDAINTQGLSQNAREFEGWIIGVPTR